MWSVSGEDNEHCWERGDEKINVLLALGEKRWKTYGPSVQVKTWEKPQERTWASDSVWDGAIAIGVAGRSKNEDTLFHPM